MSKRPFRRTARTRALALCAHAALLGAALPLLAEDSAKENEATPRADLNSNFSIDDAHPERSLPTPEQAMKNPLEMGYLMMDFIARAEAASQRGDHATAVRYYSAVARAVPDRSISFSKLCSAYQALGDRTHALENCKLALSKGGATSEDYVHFVHLVAGGEGPLSGTDVQDVDAVVQHLEKELHGDAKGRLTVAHLRCEVAAKLEDSGRLKVCTDSLARLAPDDPRTFTYRWALSLAERDFDASERVLADARAAKLPPRALARMASGLEEMRTRPAPWSLTAQKYGAWVGSALMLGLGFVVLVARRRPRLGTA